MVEIKQILEKYIFLFEIDFNLKFYFPSWLSESRPKEEMNYELKHLNNSMLMNWKKELLFYFLSSLISNCTNDLILRKMNLYFLY